MEWYWIVVTSEQGRNFLHDVPYKRYKEAERVSDDKYGGRGRVVPLETSDKVEAARILRQQLAVSGQGSWGRNFRHGGVKNAP